MKKIVRNLFVAFGLVLMILWFLNMQALRNCQDILMIVGGFSLGPIAILKSNWLIDYDKALARRLEIIGWIMLCAAAGLAFFRLHPH
jgi:Mn2+/Fe2+ NRAMP family transporter